MKEICIIPCGNKKIWDKEPNLGEVRAGEAYIGTFHRLSKAYATKFFDEYLILSAKHGFLRPDDVVDELYDLSFSMKSKEVISVEELKAQLKTKGLDKYERFVVLTGSKYFPILDQTLPANVELNFPLLDCDGIGFMQRELKRAVERNSPLHDNRSKMERLKQ
ncbi:DUF6884 domain-containing protein [Salipaludibacillus sp. HK11]|uniref:DUF6884 domain-containing protein n=1 Tax=Salipaludibacillus sp. HK11 TaxID=3394320 RepID=UPI0039FD4B44